MEGEESILCLIELRLDLGIMKGCIFGWVYWEKSLNVC